MIDLQRSVSIARSPNDVFAFVSRIENEPRWHTDVVDVKRVDSGPAQAGARYDLKFKPMMGQSEGTLQVARLSPPGEIEVDIVFGSMKPHITFRFEPEGKGTKVTRRVQVKGPGMMKLMPFMMRRMVSKRSQQFLANLKTELEGRPR